MKLAFRVRVTGEHRTLPVEVIRDGNPTVVDTAWAGGPVYFLYDDGKVSLQSQNLPHHVFPEFGINGRLIEA